MNEVLIAPSILSADFTRLGEDIRALEAAGADWIHVDVMDGHFVPNISFGALVVDAARRVTQLPLDVHLMIEAPERYLARFADAGATSVTVHTEACVHLHRTVEQIHQLGMRAGVALNPATPVSALDEIAPYLDLVLVMSVNPGFGGQKYIPTTDAKLRSVRSLLRSRSADGVVLQVDGGVGPGNAGRVAAAGADALVAGSAIFQGAGGVADNLRELRDAANRGRDRDTGSGERG